MIMSENEIIHLIFSRICLRKPAERLIHAFENIFLMAGKTVAARPPVAEPEGYPWMEKAEKELRHTVVEKPAQKTVSERNRAQTVAMTETEHTPADLDLIRLLKLLHAKLLEIAVCPHVVISLKEIHLHPPVHKILKSGKNTDIPFRHHIPVLIPEIPYVAKQIKSLRILGKRTQEAGKTPLAVRRVIDLETEMDIRDKICIAALFHVMVEDPSLRSG